MKHLVLVIITIIALSTLALCEELAVSDSMYPPEMSSLPAEQSFSAALPSLSTEDVVSPFVSPSPAEPMASPMETPMATPMETPMETPMPTPMPTPVATPMETPLESAFPSASLQASPTVEDTVAMSSPEDVSPTVEVSESVHVSITEDQPSPSLPAVSPSVEMSMENSPSFNSPSPVVASLSVEESPVMPSPSLAESLTASMSFVESSIEVEETSSLPMLSSPTIDISTSNVMESSQFPSSSVMGSEIMEESSLQPSPVFPSASESVDGSVSVEVSESQQAQESTSVVASPSDVTPEYTLEVFGLSSVGSCSGNNLTAVLKDSQNTTVEQTSTEWTLVTPSDNSVSGLVAYLSALSSNSAEIARDLLPLGVTFTIRATATYQGLGYSALIAFSKDSDITVVPLFSTVVNASYDSELSFPLTVNVPDCVSADVVHIAWNFTDNALQAKISDNRVANLLLPSGFFPRSGGVFTLNVKATFNGNVLLSRAIEITASADPTYVPPTVTLTVLSQLTSGVFNRRSKLSIKAVISPSSASILWQAKNAQTNENVDISSIAESETTTLVISAGALAKNTTYIFSLTAIASEGSTTKSVTITTSSPPSGGSVLATPSTGQEFVTRFQISTAAWENAYAGGLLYTFAYIAGGSEKVVQRLSTSTNYTLYLPRSATQVKVYAQNAIGDFDSTTYPVTVSSLSNTQLVSATRNIISSLSASDPQFISTSSAVINSIASIDYSNNVEQLREVQAIIASVLNKLVENISAVLGLARRNINAGTITREQMDQVISFLTTTTQEALLDEEIADIAAELVELVTSVSAENDVYDNTIFTQISTVASNLEKSYPTRSFSILQALSAGAVKNIAVDSAPLTVSNSMFTIWVKNAIKDASIAQTYTLGSSASVALTDISGLLADSNVYLSFAYYTSAVNAAASDATIVSGSLSVDVRGQSPVTGPDFYTVSMPITTSRAIMATPTYGCRIWDSTSERWVKSNTCTLQSSSSGVGTCSCSASAQVVISDETPADPKGGLSSGAIAGIVIGIVAALVIVVVIVGLIIVVGSVYHKKRQSAVYQEKARKDKLINQAIDAQEFHELNDI